MVIELVVSKDDVLDPVTVGDDTINVNVAGSGDEGCAVVVVTSATGVVGVRLVVSDMLPVADWETPVAVVPWVV